MVREDIIQKYAACHCQLIFDEKHDFKANAINMTIFAHNFNRMIEEHSAD